MSKQLKLWYAAFDIPSGSIMGIYTLVVIALSVVSFLSKRSIDSSVVTAYAAALGGFTVNKTAKAMRDPS